MTAAYLFGTLLMGVLVLAAVALVRLQGWYSYTAAVPVGGGRDPHPIVKFVRWPVLWTGLTLVGGLLLVLALAAFFTVPAAPAGLFGGPIFLATLLVVALFAHVGVYLMARARGHSRALALGATSLVLGALSLLAIAALLLAG